MPPGSAIASSRAATLTPSPKMSSSSTITSPRLMPMRNWIQRAGVDVGVAPRHALLDLDRALHRLGDALELDQHAVAGGLDDAALVLGDRRVDQLEPVGLAAARACPPRRPPSAGCSRPCRRRGSLRACARVRALPFFRLAERQSSRFAAWAKDASGMTAARRSISSSRKVGLAIMPHLARRIEWREPQAK